VFAFLALAMLGLAVVPAINLRAFAIGPRAADARWWHRAVLFNLDFAQRGWSRVLYALGISSDPPEVVIGKDGWMYLGDQYGQAITRDRGGAALADPGQMQLIGAASRAWQVKLGRHGVRRFLVMVCPNKQTIYPEFAPDWARPTTPSPTDALMAYVDPGIYLDMRPQLLAAKARFPLPLYYRTDTHWNLVGAWVGYRALAAELGRTEPGLRWLSYRDARISTVRTRDAGDLSRFLRLNTVLKDDFVGYDFDVPIDVEQVDPSTGQVVAAGGNPMVAAPLQPLLVRSPRALNKAKVLWLRDSFGEAIAPFMAATFSQTLQLHYSAATNARYMEMVETFKPDYVIVSVVERDAQTDWFAKRPPDP
jgi:hypothetical protein